MAKKLLNIISTNKVVVVRIIVFVFAWLNTYLVSRGMQELPVLSEESVSNFLTFAISIWTLCANNSLQKKEQ